MNRKVLSGVAGLLAVGAMSLSAFAATLKPATVNGLLIGMKCYSALGATNRAHGKTCGKQCLESGFPAGILVHGHAWVLATDPRPLAPYDGLNIKVTGKMDSADHVVIPSKIEVNVHGQWEAIKLTQAM